MLLAFLIYTYLLGGLYIGAFMFFVGDGLGLRLIKPWKSALSLLVWPVALPLVTSWVVWRQSGKA